MFQMQHLVIHDVLESATWNGRVVEDATYHDRVMSGIVVPEAVACMIAAPSHPRPGQEPEKEARVQFVEDCFQVVSMATGRLDAFAAANLPHQISLLGDIVTGDISAIATGMLSFNGATIHLCQQN